MLEDEGTVIYSFETKDHISEWYTDILHEVHQGYICQLIIKSPWPPTELGKNAILLTSYNAIIRRKK